MARGGFQSVRRSVVRHRSLPQPRLQDLDRRCFDKAVSSAPYLSQLRYIVTKPFTCLNVSCLQKYLKTKMKIFFKQ